MKNKSAFTLVELLTVIAVIFILASMFVSAAKAIHKHSNPGSGASEYQNTHDYSKD